MIALLLFSLNSFGQQTIDITAGIGFPEALNIGFRYQKGHNRYGLGGFYIPVYTTSILSLSGDYYWHFGGHAYQTEIKPFYLRLNLNYSEILSDSNPVEKYLYITFRIGNQFNFSKRFGFELDVGPRLCLYKLSEPGFLDPHDSIIPAFSIMLYYRFPVDKVTLE